MDYLRVVLAAFAAFIVYMALGALLFTRRTMRAEFQKYPAVYRSQESMKAVMPIGMVGMFLSMLALAALFARIHPEGAPLIAGMKYGAVIGVFSIGSFVLHNHVNLNIGGRLTALQAVAYFVEWLAVGVVIAAVYR
ncbi:MAG TPA: hypothetical protein VL484_07300 [Vicinamibacterales bacterium]|jgi:hypothetical protein|nr:hypothetical protein [Vicinamibacterales bacterium]